MDVDISTVADSPREPALMRMQMEVPFVPRKATISRFATNPTRTFFTNALKADRNHGFIRAISFNDLQEFHLMTDHISLYDYNFHLMTEPTDPQRNRVPC